MEIKVWLLIIRILNLCCAGMLIGFDIWYMIELFTGDRNFFGVMLRIWAPIFLILFAILVMASEFKYQKILQNFKFMQTLPGLALFNLLAGSIIAFQFSDVNQTTAAILSSMFVLQAILFLIFGCLKPTGSEGLLSEEN